MAFKKMRLMDSMEAEKARTKRAAVAEDLGREIRVFTNSATSLSSDVSASSNAEEPDDFYDLTPEDYYHVMSDKIGAQCQVLKTRKIREAEATACRARLIKAVIRVCFPDGYILEAEFHPSENIQCLVDLLMKVVARPDLPFYLCKYYQTNMFIACYRKHMLCDCTP